MLRVTVTDRNTIDPLRVGLTALSAIRWRHPKELVWRKDFMAKLDGTAELIPAIERSRASLVILIAKWRQDAARFEAASRIDRIYP